MHLEYKKKSRVNGLLLEEGEEPDFPGPSDREGQMQVVGPGTVFLRLCSLVNQASNQILSLLALSFRLGQIPSQNVNLPP